jgi:ParB/RepB/Spo0J family partition protein
MTQTASTTSTIPSDATLALDSITVRQNIRDLDSEHVDSLAQSIKLRGLLVPVIVRPVDGRHELVAGYHRIAACRKLGLTDVPVVVREHEGSSADTAAENLARKQLGPVEEARALQAMLDEGYTPDGAAQALGWSAQRVAARTKILKLSDAGQRLVGTGALPLTAIDNLLRVGDVSQPVMEAIVTAITRNVIDGGQFLNNPAWVIQRALNMANAPFAATLATVKSIDSLRLGKKYAALMVEAEKLHRQVDQYAYGPPAIRFADSDADQARAAGVLIEFAGAGDAPIVTDKAVYRQIAKQAISRTVDELRARAAAKAKGKRPSAAAKRDRTPREEVDVEHRANLRELTRQAHGVNLDLGSALLKDLAVVAPDDMDVARCLAFGILGPQTTSYLGTSDHVARTIAANGLRLVLDEHRTTTTPTLKSGKLGKTKVAYGEPDDAMTWMWRFVDGATTAGDLYGRVLVVFAAQHYACQLVLPIAKRLGSVLPRSHNDTARKAFERITKKVLPASYTQLQRALTAEANTYRDRVDELDTGARAPREADEAIAADSTDDDTTDDVGADPQDLDDDAEPEAA